MDTTGAPGGDIVNKVFLHTKEKKVLGHKWYFLRDMISAFFWKNYLSYNKEIKIKDVRIRKLTT